MSFEETDLGYVWLSDKFLAFFGNHKADFSSIRKKFPFLDFSSVKQVHGDVLVETQSVSLDWTTADAHYSKLDNVGLVVKTADCLPILAYHEKSDLVLAVHAGWRGIANQITKKSFQHLSSLAPTQGWRVFVGPHIQKESFLVQNDCLVDLSQNHQIDKTAWSEKRSDGWLVDLNCLLTEQLHQAAIQNSQVTWLNLDTKSDLRFHSHRRDRDLAGRQLSFIARF